MKPWAYFLLLGVVVLALVGWRVKVNSGEEEEGPRGGRRTPSVEVAVAGPAVIEDTIEAVGSLESPNVVELSPKSSGRIEYLQVREGDRVTAGQVLVRLDPSEANAQVVAAQANLAQAQSRLAEARLRQNPSSVGVSSRIEQEEANVRSAEAELEQVRQNSAAAVESARASVGDAQARSSSAQAQVANAEAQLQRERASLKNAQTKLSRTEDLYRQGFIAAQEVDDARTAVEVQEGNVKVAETQVASARQAKTSADKQVEVANLQLGMAQRTATSDVAAAEARVVSARSALKVAQANTAENPAFDENIAALAASAAAAQAQLDLAVAARADLALVSPVDGVVTARNADPGSLASPSEAVLVVQSLGWVYFRTSVPIEAASLIQQGQSVQVSVDGVSGTVEGTVSHVNAAADPQSRQFSVQVRLNNEDKNLRPGMFGRIRIVTRKVDAQVVVPKEAVKTANGRTTVVVVNDENKTDVREVTVGATDGKLVEIINGVAPNERVVTLSFQTLRPDQQVEIPKS